MCHPRHPGLCLVQQKDLPGQAHQHRSDGCSVPLQVKQHHDMLQQEREEAGIAKLQASLPKLCRPVLAMALKDCQFDAELALLMLRQFQSDAFDELATIHRKRRRIEAESSSKHRDERAADSDNDSDRQHKRSRDKSKHKKSSKRKDDKDKKSKHKHKRKRSHRSRSPALDSGSEEGPLEFGSFGIIREGDYALKKPEFAAWATEIKHIDIESLPKCAPVSTCLQLVMSSYSAPLLAQTYAPGRAQHCRSRLRSGLVRN